MTQYVIQNKHLVAAPSHSGCFLRSLQRTALFAVLLGIVGCGASDGNSPSGGGVSGGSVSGGSSVGGIEPPLLPGDPATRPDCLSDSAEFEVSGWVNGEQRRKLGENAFSAGHRGAFILRPGEELAFFAEGASALTDDTILSYLEASGTVEARDYDGNILKTWGGIQEPGGRLLADKDGSSIVVIQDSAPTSYTAIDPQTDSVVQYDLTLGDEDVLVGLSNGALFFSSTWAGGGESVERVVIGETESSALAVTGGPRWFVTEMVAGGYIYIAADNHLGESPLLYRVPEEGGAMQHLASFDLQSDEFGSVVREFYRSYDDTLYVKQYGNVEDVYFYRLDQASGGGTLLGTYTCNAELMELDNDVRVVANGWSEPL